MFAAIGQYQSVLRTETVSPHGYISLDLLLIAHDEAHQRLRTVDCSRLTHSLSAVSCEHVCYFVAHHHRQTSFVLTDRQDALVDNDLAAGQAKGVLRIRCNDFGFPLVIS